MLKKFPLDKINGTKNALFFFFRELQLITVLFLICDSYMKCGTRLISLKRVWEFHIWFRFVLMHGLFDLKKAIIPFKIKIIEKPLTVSFQDLWFLSCNKKF